MPVEFLSDEQVAAYGCFVGEPTRAEVERFFNLHDADRNLIADGVTGELAMVSDRFMATPRGSFAHCGPPAGRESSHSPRRPSPSLRWSRPINAGASGVLSIARTEPDEADPLNPAHRPSAREQVVTLVADGWSNKAIGQQLSLSGLTVKNHLAPVASKFGGGDRAQIVAIACRAGVIPASPVWLRATLRGPATMIDVGSAGAA